MPTRQRVILNYPPVSSVWHLPVGIAHLASVLKADGHDVVQRYGHIIGLEYVLLNQDRERIETALRTVRNPQSTIKELYSARVAFEEVSRSVPTQDRKFVVERNNVSYVSFYYDNDDYEDVQGAVEAVQNRTTQLFYEYFMGVELPIAKNVQPDVYGISIADERQLIQGLVLASLIKDALPSTLVVIGGNFWSRVISLKSLQSFAPLFDFCDAIVYAEGYQPMQALVTSLDPQKSSGTVWREGKAVHLNPRPTAPTDFEALPTPVFDGGARQWSPEHVYPLYTMSNCPMKCGFCAIAAGSDTYLQNPRAVSPRRIAEHMVRLGAQRFDFTDELMPIQRQLALGIELRQLSYPATWQCYLTVTNRLLESDVCRQLYDAGCRSVQLGLETLSPETLKREDKEWNHPQNYGQILRNLEQAGIQTHVFLIVGLPGEPLHWGLQWLPFLEDYGDSILTIKSGRYRLTRYSPDEQFGRHSEFIKVLPDTKTLHLNRDFQYLGEERSLRKDVEAMRDLLEQACHQHWAYSVTSTIPWWINRGRYTWGELRTMAEQLPRDGVRHFDRVLSRVSSIVRHELGRTVRLTTYDDALSLARSL